MLAVGSGNFNVSGERVSRWTISRLLADGRKDPSFGVNGDLVPDYAGSASDVEVLPDGRFVVVGTGADPRGGLDRPAIVVARFHPGGAPDDSFGTGGRVVISVPEENGPEPVGIERQADGRLLVGVAGTAAGSRLLAVRLGANGARETAYGDDGLARLAIGPSGSVTDVVAQPDGALVAVGSGTAPDGTSAFAVMRLTPAGQPDDGFGFEGLTLGPAGGLSASGVALAPDGRILVAGSGSDRPFLVVRYTTAGRLDTTFGTNGIAEPTWDGTSRSRRRSSSCRAGTRSSAAAAPPTG